jgi:hypothetical protein
VDGDTYKALKALEGRIELLESERAAVAHAIRQYGEFFDVVEVLRSDLESLPTFMARIPKQKEMPPNLRKALRHHGAIDVDKLDEVLQPGKGV